VDRDDIERSDFPAARRGYDPAAVHEHLRRVADGFDALAREKPAGGMAAATSEQVRAILEAAERGAAELRADAGREASGHVEQVEAAAKDLLGRLDTLHTELDRLLEGLKGTAASITGSLEALSRDVGTLGASAAPAAEPAESPPPAESPAPAAAAAEPAAESPAPATNGAARTGDEAGARLVALNMALEGTPREETAAFLAEHYEVADLETLLDDVYASAGR
jgi:DivIVA domain-containing protein